jgi:putative tricarboxylic transport membrane protein
MAGKSGKLAVTGFAVVTGGLSAKSQFKASDAEPIARMYSEYIGIFVRADSKYKKMKRVVRELKADPQSMAIVGASLGGVDSHTATQMFKALKLDTKDMNYTGSGGVLADILSDADYAFAISSYGDMKSAVESGDVRVLAISAPKRVAGIKAPTLRKAGVNTVVQNWRGILVPPKTSAAGKALVLRALDVVQASETYKEYLVLNRAEAQWLPGDRFDTFLKRFELDMRTLYVNLGLL